MSRRHSLQCLSHSPAHRHPWPTLHAPFLSMSDMQSRGCHEYSLKCSSLQNGFVSLSARAVCILACACTSDLCLACTQRTPSVASWKCTHARHVSEHLLCCTFISCVSCDEPNAVPAYVALHRSLVLFPLATAHAAGGIARTEHTTLTIVHPFMTSHGLTIIACMQCGPRDAGCSRVHCHTPS